MLASSEKELQRIVIICKALDGKGVHVNVSKIKVMVFEKDDCETESRIMIADEKLEQVKEFVYL